MAKEKDVKENDVKENDVKENLTELDAVKKEIAELLAATKKEASEIISSAKASVRADVSAPVIDEAERARGEELVDVFLFKDSGKYSDDVYVCVNGENCLIQRGVNIKVKRKFYEVLMNSQAQDTLAADKAQKLSNDFEAKTRRLGE